MAVAFFEGVYHVIFRPLEGADEWPDLEQIPPCLVCKQSAYYKGGLSSSGFQSDLLSGVNI